MKPITHHLLSANHKLHVTLGHAAMWIIHCKASLIDMIKTTSVLNICTIVAIVLIPCDTLFVYIIAQSPSANGLMIWEFINVGIQHASYY